MKNLNQLLLEFDYKQNFSDDDFYVSKSNFYPFELVNKWPKWEKNFLNISGEKFSGKTHLIKIFLKKFNGNRLETNLLNDENLRTNKPYQNIVLEKLNLDVNEKLIYSLFNIIDQDNKFLIITSLEPITVIDFRLEDLKSRTKNCLLAKIENPDD
jgi:chromosomal replication initiation ATPase DnaA